MPYRNKPGEMPDDFIMPELPAAGAPLRHGFRVQPDSSIIIIFQFDNDNSGVELQVTPPPEMNVVPGSMVYVTHTELMAFRDQTIRWLLGGVAPTLGWNHGEGEAK